jgi:PAS domain S-box-containing protein/putative nucleotidyltransferase with HDIG domain
MTLTPSINEPQNLSELAWTYAPGSMFAFDCDTGILVDANPAAEALSGYSRAELLGMNIATLHPEAERSRVKSEIKKTLRQPSQLPSDFHLQRKDGGCVPVMISSSKSLVLDGRAVAIFVYLDIIDLVEKEHQLSVKNWALSAYASAAMAFASARSSKDLLEDICEAIAHKSIYVLAWVGIAEDGPDKKVRIAAAAGSAMGFLDGLQVSWLEDVRMGLSPTGISIHTGKVKIIEDSEVSGSYTPWRERARQFGIRSMVAIPFSFEENRRGALMVYSTQPNAFEAPAIEVFQYFAGQIVHAVHALDQEKALNAGKIALATTQKQLTEALSAMVAPMMAAMEMRDPYTAGHESRVAEIAVAIGKEMGWSEDRLQGLRVAALVHDIGKISIPAEILTKPTRLTAGEWALIQEHPETGYTILKDIPFAWSVAEIVRQHHEKLDGSGYPQGLKGDAILPEAKILAVADIVEAMTAHRPYRPGIKLDVVLQQIQRDAGSLLDAEAVRICAALFHKKRLVLLNPYQH